MSRKETIEKMAWIISGAQGSGKTTTARQIAAAHMSINSSLKYTSWEDLKNEFVMGTTLYDGPAVVIVEGVPTTPSKEEWARMKSLASEEKIWIERKGRDRELVDAPVFIFVLDGPFINYFVGCRHFRLVILP